jgi:hypothetical protein
VLPPEPRLVVDPRLLVEPRVPADPREGVELRPTATPSGADRLAPLLGAGLPPLRALGELRPADPGPGLEPDFAGVLMFDLPAEPDVGWGFAPDFEGAGLADALDTDFGTGLAAGLSVGLETALGAERASLERRVAYRGGVARCGADRVSGYSSAARCTGADGRLLLVMRLGLSGMGFCGVEFLVEPSDHGPVPDRDVGCRVGDPVVERAAVGLVVVDLVVVDLVVVGRVVVGREVVGRAGADLATGARTGRTGLALEIVFESAESVVDVSVGLGPRHALRRAPTSPTVSSRH